MTPTLDPVSLSELAARIRAGLASCFPGRYWVVAEIGELSVNRNGNCYLELIEKDSDTDLIRTKIRAILPAYSYRLIRPYFESVTGRKLEAGIRILVEVSVEYHEVYGLSLQIRDINPTYTVGELAQARRRVIQRLTEEGVFEMNRSLIPSPVLQRIAVISSETAAGYGDFCHQLDHNSWGYQFFHPLFPAVMQGNEAQSSLIAALDAIHQSPLSFDAVAIVRGGGSRSDLQCFDQYELASYIAQFPLPVLTGIGHDRDESVADLVAFKSLKTPTAVAEYLIGEANAFESRFQAMAYAGLRFIRDVFQKETQNLETASRSLLSTLHRTVANHSARLESVREKLPSILRRRIQSEQQRLDFLGTRNELLDPLYTLRRGYSITRYRGKAVKSSLELNKGDRIETFFSDGTVESSIG